MESFIESVAQLLAESQALLEKPPSSKVEFLDRRSALYQLCTTQGRILTPAVHLWEPDRDTLVQAVLEWEPNLKGESFWVAVHGHPPSEMCGGKLQRTQLCHMAYFKPTGVETENFNKKWNYLYADPERDNSSPPLRYQYESIHISGEGGIRPGGMDFMVGKDFG